MPDLALTNSTHQPRGALPEMTRPQAVATAQRMRDGGWTAAQIRDYLAQRGHDVTIGTVRRWADPEQARKHREDSRARSHRLRAAARGGRMGREGQSAEFRDQRLRALRDAGLSMNAIAKVMTLDFPDTPLTERQVRTALTSDRPPIAFRRPRW